MSPFKNCVSFFLFLEYDLDLSQNLSTSTFGHKIEKDPLLAFRAIVNIDKKQTNKFTE